LLQPAEEFIRGTQMQNFACDPRPKAGWSANWKVEDRLNLLPKGSDVHLRYTDLTVGAEVYTAEGWLAMDYNSSDETWIPRVLVRRRASGGELASLFLGIIEPYEGGSRIREVRRPTLHTAEGTRFPESFAAVEVRLASGECDLFISADVLDPLGRTPSGKAMIQREWNVAFEGDTCWVRKGPDGKLSSVAICKPGMLSVGETTIRLKEGGEYAEVLFRKGKAVVVGGSTEYVEILSADAPDLLQNRSAGRGKDAERVMKIRASYYQQFDADLKLDVPGEGYGGWRTAEIEISPEHTALVVMHAWDCGTPQEFPGWYRCVEYIPRANEICRAVFPRLLTAVRSSPLKLFHVVSHSGYYENYPGYKRAVKLAGPAPPEHEQAPTDPVIERLRQFRAENVFVGRHNQEDVDRGFKRLDFAPEAMPLGDEGIAATSEQLFALCKESGVSHLIYAGFAIDNCLLLSPGGMSDMSRRGIMCSTIRQAVTAVENKETARKELAKEIALWRVALLYGFVFDLEDFISALETLKP